MKFQITIIYNRCQSADDTGTAFFNFKAKDGFFTKNSVYARTKNRAQHFSMHPAEAAVSLDRIQIDLDVREFFPRNIIKPLCNDEAFSF